jgi:hypothetical protein
VRCAQSSGCESSLTNGIRKKERDKLIRPSGHVLPIPIPTRLPNRAKKRNQSGSGHVPLIRPNNPPVHPHGPGLLFVHSIIHHPPYTQQLKEMEETSLPSWTDKWHTDVLRMDSQASCLADANLSLEQCSSSTCDLVIFCPFLWQYPQRSSSRFLIRSR